MANDVKARMQKLIEDLTASADGHGDQRHERMLRQALALLHAALDAIEVDLHERRPALHTVSFSV